MKVLGKPIAEVILADLKDKIHREQLVPRLAVILAGENPASRTYIRYKKQAAEKIGIKLDVYEFSVFEKENALKKIDELNNDPNTHGIIVQLPLFESWNAEEFVNRVDLQKDVDGFISGSPFSPATAAAAWEMLGEFARIEKFSSTEKFLENKQLVVLGKGRTAGKPIRTLLENKGFEPALIDSQTHNPQAILQSSDVIISATGKKHIVNGSNVKEDAYVIGIGVGKETLDGAEYLYGDIDEEEIAEIAKLYCPTIGGVGPLTIACLLRNVVLSVRTNVKK